MKILLFGGSGQLGHEIKKRAADLNFEVASPVESEVDIRNLDQLDFLLEHVQPELVINAAAYTNVEKAETEKDVAFKVNSEGAGNVARASRGNAKFIHLSTDYVFDGSGNEPLKEDAEVKPINVYGLSKAAGEKEVFKEFGEEAIVLRTSSLHGYKGVNFVNTMLRLFSEGKSPAVVNDQYMSPTWAGWLAEVILDLGRTDSRGLIHASCAGQVSWYEFAVEILAMTEKVYKDKKLEVTAVPAAEYPTVARRPHYSVLDCHKLSGILGRQPIHWKEGLKQHLKDAGIKTP